MMVRKIPVLIGLLILLSSLILPACKPVQEKATPTLAPAMIEEESESEEGDKVEERHDWFTFQRAYPFEEIPENGRRDAWRASQLARNEESNLENISATIWESIGPAPTISAFMNNWGMTSGRINTVAISPNNANLFLIGSATGGIFRSTDGGANFTPTTENQVDLAVSSIAFSKSNPNIVYAGLGDYKGSYWGTGVLKSTDAGATWTRVNTATLPTRGQASEIEVDPTNSNRVYLAQNARLSDNSRLGGGFYLSTDGGVNWTKTLTGFTRDMVLDIANPQIIYLGMARIDEPVSTPAGLYRSTDRGISWQRIFTTPYDSNRATDVRIAVSQVSPQVLYLYTGGLINSSLNLDFYVSTDGGASFTERHLSTSGDGIDPAQFGYNTYIFTDPSNANTIYLGARDVFKSTDGGVSWANKTKNFRHNGNFWGYVPQLSNAHPDQHALTFSPTNSNEVYLGNDGGIFKSTNGGESFTSLNTALNLTMFTSLALHPTDPTITYGGTQDNGTQRRTPTANFWQEFFGGDGGRVVINPLDPSIVFTTYIRGSVYRYSRNTSSFDNQIGFESTFGEPSTSPRIAFYPPFTGNGVDQTIYFGTWRLFVSSNLGSSWSSPAGDLDLTKGVNTAGPDVLNAIGVGPANPNVIYTGSRQGRAMVSTDAGFSWRDVTTTLPNRTITGIVVDPTNSAIAYLTVSGFGSGHIFKTTNSGQNWTDISNNLPDIPTSAFLIDPIDDRVFYAGTDIGVFQSKDSGTSWEYFNQGMPPAVVTAFTSQKSGLVQVATYGRGAFQINRNVRPRITTAEFTTPKILLMSGEGFGSSPKVFINDVDQSGFIKKGGSSSIKLKGKAKNMGIKAGDNSIRVESGGLTSDVFTFKN
jgi:photosystem II stability/assembly factor-like uncharacterized protein